MRFQVNGIANFYWNADLLQQLRDLLHDQRFTVCIAKYIYDCTFSTVHQCLFYHIHTSDYHLLPMFSMAT